MTRLKISGSVRGLKLAEQIPSLQKERKGI